MGMTGSRSMIRDRVIIDTVIDTVVSWNSHPCIDGLHDDDDDCKL